MKKQLFLSTLLCILFSLYNFAQIDYGNVSIIRQGHQSTLPAFIKFKPNSEVPLALVDNWLRNNYELSQETKFELLRVETDFLGHVH